MGVDSMKICVIDSKECWRDDKGTWFSTGGFPLQMAAIGSLFDEMTLLVVGVEPQEGGMALPSAAKVVPLKSPHGSNIMRKLSVLVNLFYYLKTIFHYCRKADVVHVPVPGDLQFLGFVSALMLRKRLIARYIGSWTPTSQTSLMNRVTRALMRVFAGGRNVMFATGEGEKPPAEKIRWIFATALWNKDLAQIQPRFDRGFATPPRLMYAGRLSSEKGVDILLRALAHIKAKRFLPMPVMILAGDGPDREMLTKMKHEFGLDGTLQLAGQLDRKRLSEEFLNADICVHASLSESLCKAWLDAMAHGLPVLCSDVGAARSVMGFDGERGWVVPPGDVEALADKLMNVISSKLDWPAMRRRCRAFVENKTLENWAGTIGSCCAKQWGLRLVAGKLQ